MVNWEGSASNKDWEDLSEGELMATLKVTDRPLYCTQTPYKQHCTGMHSLGFESPTKVGRCLAVGSTRRRAIQSCGVVLLG
eukprot:1141711-Prorocentrum_minimum.AAC.1